MSGSYLFYGELNGIALGIPDEGDAFTLTKELCNIGYFEFAVENSAVNRATIDANYTHDFYIKRISDDAEVFRGCIGKKRYIDRTSMQLSGHEWYTTLSHETFKHMHAADTLTPECVCTYSTSGGSVDCTTEATNATINDVSVLYDATMGSIRIGYSEPFSSIKVKYSTPGVCSEHDLSYCYMYYNDGFSTTEELPVLDLSQGFTKPAGTYYIIFDPPPLWVENTFCSNRLFYFYMRIDPLRSTPYTTNPVLDQIWVGRAINNSLKNQTRINPFRIEYIDTAANTILSDVLAGTGFSAGSCPSTQISIRGEYQTSLQWVAAIANTLTRDVGGYKQPYEWYVNSATNSVTIALIIQPGETPNEDGQWFSLLDSETCYDEVATRVIGLGAFTGMQQPSSYAEDYDATEIRELVISDLRFANQATFDAHTQKVLTGLRVPPQQISVDVPTSALSAQHYGWIDHYAIGQKVQIKQPAWGITDTKYRIMRARIGPFFTKLDLSIKQKHLETLRSDLAAKIDIADIWPAGAALQSYDGGYV